MKQLYSLATESSTRKGSQKTLFILTLFFLFVTTTVSAQSVFSGVVSDSIGNPLTGVSVQVKGTRSVVASDASGRFSIQARATDILVFSMIGFAPTEVPASSSATVS